MAEAAAENIATPVRRGGKMKRVTGMVAMMYTLAIYEQFRAVLGEERAKGFAQTFGTMIEEAKNAATTLAYAREQGVRVWADGRFVDGQPA